MRAGGLFLIPGDKNSCWSITALNEWKVILRCELIDGPVALTNTSLDK
jgi:hypothetical protein